jgi:hypothetical protein
MKKWAWIVCAAIMIWVAVVVIAYRRNIHSKEQRQRWERYYLASETRAILDGSEKFVLISVDPVPLALEVEASSAKSPKDAAQRDPREYFHEHRVLGRREIKDAKRKAELLAALYSSVEKYRGDPAACFNPRHGIVATAGTNRVELLICFECSSGAEFGDSDKRWFLIGEEPQELFNRTLTEAGVPLAKK